MSSFDKLTASKKPNSNKDDDWFDEWGGAFGCTVTGCYEAATTAQYYPSKKILRWTCPVGHVTTLSDVDE